MCRDDIQRLRCQNSTVQNVPKGGKAVKKTGRSSQKCRREGCVQKQREGKGQKEVGPNVQSSPNVEIKTQNNGAPDSCFICSKAKNTWVDCRLAEPWKCCEYRRFFEVAPYEGKERVELCRVEFG